MSFIDTFRHELVGHIGGVPLYHPQERVHGEVTATVNDLLLGGGSGEFPAAVANVAACAARAVMEYADALENADADTPLACVAESLSVTATELGELVDALDPGAALDPVDFSGWGGNAWAYVVKQCRRSTHGPRYRRGRDGGIESWLACVIGEYALVSYPQLVAAGVPEQHRTQQVAAAVAKAGLLAAHTARYAAVAQWPSGYRLGGRGERFDESNMRH